MVAGGWRGGYALEDAVLETAKWLKEKRREIVIAGAARRFEHAESE
jgi:hypothetical protein